MNDGGDHILPVHAEVEGGVFEEKFRQLLKGALTAGMEIATLDDLKNSLNTELLPRRKYQMDLLPGRHSPCAV
jgi:uncharacterized NAD-dependent epimerase/dehydratase family protein